MTASGGAWAQFVTTVLPYFATLCVAICTVGAGTLYNWARTKGLQKQVDEQGKGAATTVVAVQASPQAGAGPQPLQAPAWNQLNDPLPDNAQDPFATTDCGEESVAMTIAACGGPPLPAGTLRMLLGGPNRPGVTDAGALCYLLGLFGIKAHPRQCDADTAWVEWGNSYNAKYPILALGYWVSPGYLHWVLVVETTAAGIQFHDPWGGLVRTMDKGTAQKLYGGWYVHVDQPVTQPAAAPPGT